MAKRSILSLSYLILCGSFIIANSGFAQNEPMWIIKGTVIEKSTKKSVEFAAISIRSSSIGCVTNEYGQFRLAISKDSTSIELIVSALGYKTEKLQVHPPFDKVLQIELIHNTYSLNEIEIRAKSKKRNIEKIVEQAIDSIPRLFYMDTLVFEGYYRDYIKHDSIKYINLYEAIIKVIDPGYDHYFDRQKYALLAHAYRKTFQVDSLLLKKYDREDSLPNKFIPGYKMPVLGGNEFNILNAHNALRRYNDLGFSFIGIFQKDFVKNHSFKLDSMSVWSDEAVYCISFNYNKNEEAQYKSNGLYYTFEKMIKKYNVYGRIIIGKVSKIIYKFEYTNDANYKVIIDTRKHQNKVYTSYVSFSNFFKVIIPPSLSKKYKVSASNIPPYIKSITQRNASQIYIRFSKPLNVLEAQTIYHYELSGFLPSYHKNNPSASILPKKVAYLPKDTTVILYLERDLGDVDTKDGVKQEYISNIRVSGITDNDGIYIHTPLTLNFVQNREFFITDVFSKMSNEFDCEINLLKPMYDQVCKDSVPVEKFNYMMTLPLK